MIHVVLDSPPMEAEFTQTQSFGCAPSLIHLQIGSLIQFLCSRIFPSFIALTSLQLALVGSLSLNHLCQLGFLQTINWGFSDKFCVLV